MKSLARIANESLVAFAADIETGVAGGVGQSLDATVIFVTFTVESDGGNAGGESAFADHFTDNFGRGDVAAVRVRFAEILFVSARAGQGFAGEVVDDLAADVTRATEDAQTRTSTVLFNGVGNSEFASNALFVQTQLFSHVNTTRFD